MLSGLDLSFIIIYFALTLFIGFSSGRKKTTNGFLIADRSLGTFSGLSTILSSKIGAGLLVSYVAAVYAFGISALWYFVGCSLGYLIFYLFIIKLKKNVSSTKEYLGVISRIETDEIRVLSITYHSCPFSRCLAISQTSDFKL